MLLYALLLTLIFPHSLRKGQGELHHCRQEGTHCPRACCFGRTGWRSRFCACIPRRSSAQASLLTPNSHSQVVGTPAEVVLVRMCGDLNKPPVERYNYSHALSGVWRIASQEGPSKLLRGMTPTVAKGVTLNVGQLAG